MILVNELRIGNLVYWNIPEKMQYKYNDGRVGSVPHEVVAILNRSLHTIPISLGKLDKGDYIGIPLTEEWLVRLGFKFKNGYGYTFVRGYVTKSDKYWIYHDICVKINYVHQLQNLYFALTGTELTYKI